VKELSASLTPHPESFAGQLERLSNLTLAAGKDFNDELTLILNHVEISLDLLGAEHPLSPDLIELQQSARRCAETARCLLQLTTQARRAVRCVKLRADDADTGDRELL
jgi:hypothetical protein